MSREFNAAVRRRFAEAMPDAAPAFSAALKGPKPWACPGEAAYSWAVDTGRRAWIIVVPSLKGYNEFTVELGWSRLGRYPELGMRPSHQRPSGERSEWALEEYLCRLDALAPSVPEWWRVAPGGDPADLLAEARAMTATLTRAEAEDAAAPLVAGALAALRAHGVPYLSAWASA